MNKYEVVELIHSPRSGETFTKTREMSNREKVVFLEDKIRKLEKRFYVLEQYLGSDKIEAIEEIENLLKENSIEQERWLW